MTEKDFELLVLAVAALCDSHKRLETAVTLGGADAVEYVEEAKKRRLSAERALGKISVSRNHA